MRIFPQQNNETKLTEWYFYAREGVIGPFFNVKESKKALEVFIKLSIEFNDDGGRGAKFTAN